MRAILVGTLNSECATWQATMLTSSCSVTAMIMSASCAPAFCSTSGCEPWPTKPRTSRLSRTPRIRSAEVSITDTSFCSAASRSAMP